jgi:micrococcal nuclease
MFGLKALFARSKAIQYTSYVVVLALIVAGKIYDGEPSSPEIKVTPELSPVAAIQEVTVKHLSVDSVTDGDTLTAGGVIYRLALIDAPEKDQPYGKEAMDFLRSLVTETTVSFTELGKDKYGRTIARADINGVSIAEMMIENGYAWSYLDTTDSFDPTVNFAFKLKQMQDKARVGRLGLWAEAEPIRPSIYREIKNAANN